MEKKKIIIIGGGAAGFFCASNLDESKFEVKILEQNADVLNKVRISGGGRCNVTHACFEPRGLVQFYPRGNRELLSVFSKFQPGDTMEWFEARNVPLKTEKDGRVFPKSNSSQSIIDAMASEVSRKQFEVKTKTAVQSIIKKENHYLVETNNGNFDADFVVCTTGSSPKSLRILENLGHKTVDAVPSLFSFNVTNELLNDLSGTSFPHAEVAIPRLKTAESGPLLITHWGLSGPAILKLSAWRARELSDMHYRCEIVVNFVGMDADQALNTVNVYRQQNPKKTIGAARIFDITNRFWHKALWLAKIDLDKNISTVSSKDVQKLVAVLCSSKMLINGKSTNKDEFVTAGGVDLKEINFKNMSSKILENIYIAGEVLNIDAVTGGFNFQACWSEAWLIAKDLNQTP